MSSSIYHRAYNPKLQTIQGVTAEVDKLEQGWMLSRVVAVSLYDAVAVFVMVENTSPTQTIPEVGKYKVGEEVALKESGCFGTIMSVWKLRHQIPVYRFLNVNGFEGSFREDEIIPRPPVQPGIMTVRLACPVALECDICPIKKHGACKANIITGEKAITK